MPSFFYFDLGNVLLFFDHRRAARQMAEVAGVDADRVWEVLFAGDLEHRYEAGELSTRQMYDLFCRQTDSRPDYDDLLRAAADIFEVNASIKPILGGLISAGKRVGLLSNTNEAHWQWCSDGRYGLIPGGFETLILSYEVQSMKPEEKIFRIAAERAGVPPQEIFYIDDMPGHVAAARKVGFDAVQYTTVPALAAELRARGVEINY